MNATRTALGAAVVAALTPAVALAHRPATASERAAVRAATVRQHQLSSAQATCQVVTISTVNDSYAELAWPQKLSSACRRVAANGVIIEHQTSRGWQLVTVGSTLQCPIKDLPTPVARDLGVCP